MPAPKLNADVQARVISAIAGGASQEIAARHGLINPATHFRWMDRGRRALARHDGHLERTAARDRAYCEYCEAVETALREYELGLLANIRDVARGSEYETTRTVNRQELGAEGAVVTLTTTTTERGRKRDWRAAAQLLKWRRPSEYGDRIAVDGELSPEQEAAMIARAVEGALAELGVARTPEVGRVVARHLTLVAEEETA